MSRSTLRGVASVVSSQVVRILVTAVFTPVFVRLLGSSRYGEYSFLMSTIALVFVACRGGLFQGLQKFVVESRPIPDWQSHVFAFYLRVAVAASLVIGALIVGATLAGIPQLVVGDTVAGYFLLVPGILLANQLFATFRTGLMPLGKEIYTEAAASVQTIAFAAGAVGVLAYGWGIGAVLVADMAAALLGAAVLVPVARSLSLRRIVSFTPDEFPHRELVTFGAYNFLLLVGLRSLYHVDVILLRVFVGSQPTGIYKAALNLAEFLWLVPIAIQGVFVYSSSELWDQKKFDALSSMTSEAVRYTAAFVGLLAIGLAVLAKPAVTLYYGESFAPASLPLQILLPGAFFFAVARPILAVGQGKGKLKGPVVATMVAAGLNIVLNLTFIPRYGLVGASVATSVSYTAMLVGHGAFSRRQGVDPFIELKPVSVALVLAVTAVVVVGLAAILSSPVAKLVLVPPAGFLAWLLTALWTDVVARERLVAVVDRVRSG